MAWIHLFAALKRRSLAHEIPEGQQRHNKILRRLGLAITAANRFEKDRDILGRLSPKEHAAASNLRRIIVLTGAKQAGDAYILDVGKERFSVRFRYVQRDVIDPIHRHAETCFYPAGHDLPRSEQIAMALLQLKNNPALFDKWAAQKDVMFRADGQVFTNEK